MTSRYCPTCGTEVTDAGGFCLLGHSLRLQPPVESLTELRAEVDRAFEAARQQLAQVIADGPGGSSAPAEPVPNGAASAPAPGGSVPDATTANGSTNGHPAARRIPPPPPPPQARTVFSGLEDGSPATNADPITAFAPPARMDWGPERSGLRKRPRHDR